jgi:hypothetical protein
LATNYPELIDRVLIGLKAHLKGFVLTTNY